MPQLDVPLNAIERFLAQKRIAMVGISRNPHDIGAQLFDKFAKLGYEVLPVNPSVPEIMGRPCYARLQDIHPAPDAALLLTSPAVTNAVVRDCAEAGIGHIWMYRGGGQGAVSNEAISFCRDHQIEVIPGQCPFMYLKPVRGIHWCHRLIFKIRGEYPRHSA
jgi:predicted CoA-binding protein